MKGSGAEYGEMGGWQGDVVGVGRRGKLSMMCWNVGGWSKKDGGDWNKMKEALDMRARVVDFYRMGIGGLGGIERGCIGRQ